MSMTLTTPSGSEIATWRAEGEARGAELLEQQRRRLYGRNDRLFAGLLVFEFLFGLALSVTVSPRTWAGALASTHPHVYAALLLGAAIVLPGVLLAWLRPAATLTRHVIAACQILMTALLIHLTGGRIETHFLVFGSLAFLAAYRDWRVLITASAVTAVDHVLRGMLWPQSIYGIVAAEQWRWLEHAGWVLFEDVFLIVACVTGAAEMRASARRQGELEAGHAFVAAAEAKLRQAHDALEEQVKQRTAELTRANAELAATVDRAESANRAKSSFLANMSHEIRTPITAVVGYSDMMLEPDQPIHERNECLQVIRRNAKHLLELIGDILDLSKIEADKMTVERIPTDVAQIAVDVVSLTRARAIEKGLTFSLTFGSEIPKRISSDPLRLKQVLMNLVGNAIKFTRTGGIRVHVSLDRAGGTGSAPRVRFDIADSGIGMTADQAAKLFQPFAQADESTTRKFGGTGLGLIISRRLTNLLGGDIHVQSLPGVGSTFSVLIDPGSLDGVEMLKNLEESMIAVSRHAPTKAPKRLVGRILLAEDGPDNQRLISAHLRRAGAEVIVADNGRIAVDFATSQSFDMIFMDMQMPELDGYGAASELRRRGWTGPIVALTAHALAGDREKCLKAGCSDYLSKPVERDVLISTAASYLKDSVPADDDGETEVASPPGATASAAASQPAEIVRSDYSTDHDMREVLAEFVAGLPQQVARINDLWRRAALDDLRRAVHQIKGAGGGYGFPIVTRVAAQAEAALKADGFADEAVRQVEELVALIRRVEGYDVEREKACDAEATHH